MNKVLIISGHPRLEASVANRTILADLEDTFGESASFRYLDQLYPDFQIDVAEEQAALLEADVVVWQFPFYWYALPALMKKWLEDVFVYGFSHGATGHSLRGKRLILSFTTGAPSEAYATGRPMNYPVAEFLPPLRQTALLCGMEYEVPVHSSAMSYVPGVSSEADLAAIKQRAHDHARVLIHRIRQLAPARAAA